MGPPSYMRSVVDRNVVMRRMAVQQYSPIYVYISQMVPFLHVQPPNPECSCFLRNEFKMPLPCHRRRRQCRYVEGSKVSGLTNFLR